MNRFLPFAFVGLLLVGCGAGNPGESEEGVSAAASDSIRVRDRRVQERYAEISARIAPDVRTALDGLPTRFFREHPSSASHDELGRKLQLSVRGALHDRGLDAISDANVLALVFVTAVDLVDRLDRAKDDLNDLGSDNGLPMINLQHVLQSRGQAVQLIANLLAALNDEETLGTLIGNIR